MWPKVNDKLCQSNISIDEGILLPDDPVVLSFLKLIKLMPARRVKPLNALNAFATFYKVIL